MSRQVSMFHQVAQPCTRKGGQKSWVRKVVRAGGHPVFNPVFQNGMFSSVQAGARAINSALKAFFLIPVDIPLVPPIVLLELMKQFARSQAGRYLPRLQHNKRALASSCCPSAA